MIVVPLVVVVVVEGRTHEVIEQMVKGPGLDPDADLDYARQVEGKGRGICAVLAHQDLSRTVIKDA